MERDGPATPHSRRSIWLSIAATGLLGHVLSSHARAAEAPPGTGTVPGWSFAAAEFAGVARSNEAVTSGVPLPRQADVRSVGQDHDALLRAVLERTTNSVDQLGLAGIQTCGLFPRYWGNPRDGYDELTNADADPTPHESWDYVYWGATWTDYHNTSALAGACVLRSGQLAWLEEIAGPAARRMLHTQIIHGAPDDGYFYVGQAPCGYGGYRAEFNSSHAFFRLRRALPEPF
jgi:hypothetical protein